MAMKTRCILRHRVRRLPETIGLVDIRGRKAAWYRASDAFQSGQRKGGCFDRNGLPVVQGIRFNPETWLGMQLAVHLSRSRALEQTIKVERIAAA